MKKPLLISCFIILAYAAMAQPDSIKPKLAKKCDVITLKNGGLIYCKVQHIGHSKITYRDCDNPAAQTVIVPADSAQMVNYPDGTYQSLTHSQGSEPPGAYIGISGGAGIPIFSFRSIGPLPSDIAGDLTSVHYSGYSQALSGYNINVVFGMPIKHSQVYLKSRAGFSSNPFDVDAYTHVYSGWGSLPGSSAVAPFNGSNEITITSESVSGNYTASKILAGLEVANKSCLISAHFMIGAAYYTFPRTIYYTRFFPVTGTHDTITVNSSPSIGFAYQFGISLRSSTRHKISLSASLDIFGGAANFPIHIVQAGNNNFYTISDPGANTATVKYILLDANIGLAYNFGK